MFPPWQKHQVHVGEYRRNNRNARVAISFNINPQPDKASTNSLELWTGTWSNSILDHDNCGTYSAVINHDLGIMDYENTVYNEDDIKFVEVDKGDTIM